MSSSKSAPASTWPSSKKGVAPRASISRAICFATQVSGPLWLTKTNRSFVFEDSSATPSIVPVGRRLAALIRKLRFARRSSVYIPSGATPREGVWKFRRLVCAKTLFPDGLMAFLSGKHLQCFQREKFCGLDLTPSKKRESLFGRAPLPLFPDGIGLLSLYRHPSAMCVA